MPRDIVDRFTTHLKNVLTRALVFAVEEKQPAVTPAMLLWALGTQKGCVGAEVLRRQHVHVSGLRSFVAQGMRAHDSINPTPPLAETSRRMLEKAVWIAHTYGHPYVGTEHLLGAMLEVQDPDVASFFTSEGVLTSTLQEQVIQVLKSASRFPEMEEMLRDAIPSRETALKPIPELGQEDHEEEKEESGGGKSETPALDFFARDLTAPRVATELDPVLAREAEITRTIEILCRRTKNNPLLLGEPGVGKTAVVEGLAKRIASGDVPAPLFKKRILLLDLPSIVAGTVYRGEFEGRMKQIIEEAREHPDLILFIDEIHTIIGAGSASGSLDAAHLLKPALARGEIRCIGATTPAEYKKHFETDAALERRFQPVQILEPTASVALTMLEGLMPAYEKYHHVRITPAALSAAIRLSTRYLHDRFLPDKAIDLLDEAAAMLRVRSAQPVPEGRKLREKEEAMAQIIAKKREAIEHERLEEAIQLRTKEQALKKEIENWEGVAPEEPRLFVVDVEEVAEVISRATGIPAQELVAEERERTMQLGPHLRRQIVGQSHATDEVAKAILRAKTGINNHNRPLASFLFVGPSGVGKTETARQLATYLFEDKRSLVVLDMSEFSESFSLSKLIGAPAGYVGYREAAKLTDQVKARPYAVVLFDEIEKAHRDVQNILLQILDQGELHDATGRKINFRNTIIVLTSNIGSARWAGAKLGFGDKQEHLPEMKDVRTDLENLLRPELLNRIDHTLLFRPLETKHLEDIAEQHFAELASRLEERGVAIQIGKAVAPWLALHAMRETGGARALRHIIETEVEPLIADRILQKKPKKLRVSLKGNILVVENARVI
ncbi:ATP-dependent Clp protease ATP-binding subunit [Candidatus Uhrbacteria bacterium]|nr:ATP-dependent Clp protease ATP-binding subunit [Candidatus Uhrbacteria bacterium]